MEVPDGLGWLAQASPELRAAVAQRSDRITLSEASALYRADDSAGGVFGVAAGRVDMHLPRWGGERSLAHVVGPGWWVGDLAAVSGAARRFDVWAQRNTTVLRLSRAEMARLSDMFPEMERCLIAMLSANMRHVIDAAESLGFRDPVHRVAACLLRLDRTGPGWEGRLPVTQAELAVIANLSRRRANAALNALETAGALQLRYAEIAIRDRHILHVLTEGADPGC